MNYKFEVISLIVLGLLVTPVHELGHIIVAFLFKVHAEVYFTFLGGMVRCFSVSKKLTPILTVSGGTFACIVFVILSLFLKKKNLSVSYLFSSGIAISQLIYGLLEMIYTVIFKIHISFVLTQIISLLPFIYTVLNWKKWRVQNEK